jgi:hypothetical protein
MRTTLLEFLMTESETWTLPIAVEHAASHEHLVAVSAVDTAEKLAERQFFPNGPHLVPAKNGGGLTWRHISKDELGRARDALLAWWESEGRTKYGGRE